MVGGIEAAADAITGGLMARTVEPEAGEGAASKEAAACLNCKTALVGNHCHACGQKAHVHRTLRAFGHEIAHGVFHFEGKVWRTLPMLAWRPGELTRRYIHGERARFVSPLALFLFSVFVMFAVFESVGGPITADRGTPQQTASAAEKKENLRKVIVASNEALAALKEEREQLVKAGKSTAEIDQKMDAAAEKLSAAAQQGALTGGFSLDDLKTNATIDTGSKDLDKLLLKGLSNPQLLAYKLQSSAYKFAWALIPLSLPFMWMMFAWRRQYKLYDHAIFVTYSLCFVMQLLVVMALASAIGWSWGFLILLIPVHFFRQLKQAYELSFVGAAWRTIGLIFIGSIVLSMFAAILIALGLSG